MNTKICYMYDSQGVYLNESLAYESPLEEGVFLLPADCTWTAPIDVESPFVPVWNGNEWVAVEDHRKHMDSTGTYVGGTAYWLPEDDYKSEPRYMAGLGSLPDGALLTKPEKPQGLAEQESYEAEIRDAKQFLSDTDYVVSKIAEASALGEDTTDLLSEYADIIAERRERRNLINDRESKAKALNCTN